MRQQLLMQLPEPIDPLVIAEFQLMAFGQLVRFFHCLGTGATEFLKDPLLVGQLIGRKTFFLYRFSQVAGAEAEYMILELDHVSEQA
ncbi:hypothetical protein [Pedobacter panaciterrae]|uniref:hypothetical protein n=1 Tax=Pedobacter panaciterrae TaxID=363849 RepID=UPI0025955150|nr:hypothetical protein [uncultured Pedobacter sp.]